MQASGRELLFALSSFLFYLEVTSTLTDTKMATPLLKGGRGDSAQRSLELSQSCTRCLKPSAQPDRVGGSAQQALLVGVLENLEHVPVRVAEIGERDVFEVRVAVGKIARLGNEGVAVRLHLLIGSPAVVHKEAQVLVACNVRDVAVRRTRLLGLHKLDELDGRVVDVEEGDSSPRPLRLDLPVELADVFDDGVDFGFFAEEFAIKRQ